MEMMRNNGMSYHKFSSIVRQHMSHEDVECEDSLTTDRIAYYYSCMNVKPSAVAKLLIDKEKENDYSRF